MLLYKTHSQDTSTRHLPKPDHVKLARRVVVHNPPTLVVGERRPNGTLMPAGQTTCPPAKHLDTLDSQYALRNVQPLPTHPVWRRPVCDSERADHADIFDQYGSSLNGAAALSSSSMVLRFWNELYTEINLLYHEMPALASREGIKTRTMHIPVAARAALAAAAARGVAAAHDVRCPARVRCAVLSALCATPPRTRSSE